MSVWGIGRENSPIMIVGEYFDRSDVEPFSGVSGEPLIKCLAEAGLMLGDCYRTCVLNLRPPGDFLPNLIARSKKEVTPFHKLLHNRFCLPSVHEEYQRLQEEITRIQPKIIIAAGDLALWALTSMSNILKWRGSVFPFNQGGVLTKVLVATLNPATTLYVPEQRAMLVADLRRVANLLPRVGSWQPAEARWQFTIRPNFKTVMDILGSLTKRLDSKIPLWIDFDLETKAGHIACAGVSWTKENALCIPFMCERSTQGYWSSEEEARVVFALYKLLTHPIVRVRGQNLLYDCQHTYRHWHFVPRVVQDTLISFHTCFAGLPKRLDFQASLFCENYMQWKPDKTSWKEGG